MRHCLPKKPPYRAFLIHSGSLNRDFTGVGSKSSSPIVCLNALTKFLKQYPNSTNAINHVRMGLSNVSRTSRLRDAQTGQTVLFVRKNNLFIDNVYFDNLYFS